jgi:Kazal-type serine protease inhibitor domain
MRFNFTFLVVFAMIQVEYCQSFDCNEGCDLDSAVNGESVCGEDGITYMNVCFAVCQVRKESRTVSRVNDKY